MGGPIAQLLWQRHRHLVAGLVLCATSSTFTGTVRERALFGVAAGTSSVAGRCPLGRIRPPPSRSERVAEPAGHRPWWGFDEVARHDWTQIVEAGRSSDASTPGSGSATSTVPTAIVMTEDDDVVPVHRQVELARLVPDATIHRVTGGHAVCTLTPERFVPQLVAACLSVARRQSTSHTVDTRRTAAA